MIISQINFCNNFYYDKSLNISETIYEDLKI